MACRIMVIRQLPQHRLLSPAFLLAILAPGLERAAWRHVRRAGNFPLQALDNMRFVLLYGKDRLQQSPGIGMPCLLQLVAIQLFHDAAQLPY